jgi:hypothetical protein
MYRTYKLKMFIKSRAVDPDSLNPDPEDDPKSGSRVLMTRN